MNSIPVISKALFASLEGKRREWKTKKEETSGRSREVWEGRSLKGYFFFITQNPPNLGNSKIVLDEGLKGLHEFFKFN
jgi:hypothetical protein